MRCCRIALFCLLPVCAFLIAWPWLQASRRARAETIGVSQPVDLDRPVGDFSLTDQNGHTVTNKDFLGKVCVFDFIFTRCGSTCPQLTANMARLQKALAKEQDVRLISISVNPTFDKPAILHKYAERHGADPNRWLFLTGDEAKIRDMSRNSFMSAMEKKPDAAPDDLVTHTTKMFVVDRAGHIRGMFDGRQIDDDLKPMDQTPQIQQKVEELLR